MFKLLQLTLIAGDKVSLEREVEQLKEQNVKLKQSLREVEIKADANQQLVDSVMHEQVGLFYIVYFKILFIDSSVHKPKTIHS